MSTINELDQLLHDRFDISRDDFVAALRTLPSVRPWATTLSDDEARLLDDADFDEDPQAYIAAGTEIAGHVGRLAVSAYTPDEVKTILDISDSRVRQKRLARELWAIPDGQSWLFPAPQFETNPTTGRPFRQVRGLSDVFKSLPDDLHPVAVDGFLHTPQPELNRDGRDQAPLDWLRDGGDVDAVIAAALASDWYSR
ncbi:hypothetical protein FZI85_27870 [Mycobacterium sp. CBMA293]|uniref:Antitoxin Xre/MbcA/ParS-like toxin-binding domain-containing protein n=1 Tax=Mycolicibacterium sp. CBMA 213 TaxID=1968788 RepID=A0A1S6GKZ2_9MYCO|nr:MULTISPECIES: hypothetical protein [unclassified Mycolicibacterium]AQS22512.1 hypothetical protein pCBMA213_2_00148 [Mycolicibacterium sp. CBMA 213]MUL48412.1 hypothetical protein [Mycolicibacterium sp. CBMA 360]MUL62424.1 hypothetical protein [Mycolicibacterium sp. CBMA 335]MUM04561.1 hypothetical protein [Mycolicibacterium sp. CBMA 213]MUM14824.1 hypothetical protein [Mycolicibacterium sp. CBMA 293]